MTVADSLRHRVVSATRSMLGYSRIPYAAARTVSSSSVFGRLHPTKRFPHISLLTIGAVDDSVLLFHARASW